MQALADGIPYEIYGLWVADLHRASAPLGWAEELWNILWIRPAQLQVSREERDREREHRWYACSYWKKTGKQKYLGCFY